MSVQRWTADGYGAQQGEMMPDPEGPWMLAADHARIVDETQARWVEIARQDRMAAHQRGAQEAERQHAKALADMEQAHAAALAAERERSYDLGYESGYEWGIADERAWVVGYLRDGKQMPSAEAQAWAHGFAEVIEQGSYNGAPAAAPSTLTADDPEPAVGSVVLDANGHAWQLGKGGLWWIVAGANGHTWAELLTLGPVTPIHDGEAGR